MTRDSNFTSPGQGASILDHLQQLAAIEAQLLDLKLSAHVSKSNHSIITLRRTIARMLTLKRNANLQASN